MEIDPSSLCAPACSAIVNTLSFLSIHSFSDKVGILFCSVMQSCNSTKTLHESNLTSNKFTQKTRELGHITTAQYDELLEVIIRYASFLLTAIAAFRALHGQCGPPLV